MMLKLPRDAKLHAPTNTLGIEKAGKWCSVSR